MSSRTGRYRSLTASSTSTPPPRTEFIVTLEELLLILRESLQNPTKSREDDITAISTTIQSLRQCLDKTPKADRPRDAFRHLDGFQTILNTIRSVSGYYHPTKRTHVEKEKLFHLLATTLALLSDAFRGHHGNRRYFKKRVEGGGWAALEQAIASIGFGGSDFDTWSENKLFGILLAFAVDNEKLYSLCQDIQGSPFEKYSSSSKKEPEESTNALQKESSVAQELVSRPAAPSSDDGAYEIAQMIEKDICDKLKDIDGLWNPDIAPTIIGFWKALPRNRPLSLAPTSIVIILALSKISAASQANLLGLHSTGILSSILPLAFDDGTGLSSPEQKAVENLCGSLMSLGLTSLEDARYLLRNRSPRAAEFLLRMTKVTQNPPHIQFDLSLNGYSSIELPTLGRSFPPLSSTAGYTFAAWVHIDRFDPDAHTTIFGAFDMSQTCFVLAYLEKDTHNFILQTSVTSSRPSVRFKSTVFKENKWYYVVVVHRRPRAITSSKAALYVDGEFVEQVKCQYPCLPPQSNPSTESFASFSSSSSKLNPVHAFIGTPQDLSSKLGHGMVFSKWSLASAHLFEEALSDEIIAVHHRLGPRYNGNFQDCLGSFQTYEASAALSMRNDIMHPGKDEKSEIVTAIRDKASNLIPEARIVFSILPIAILGDDIQGELDMPQLVGGLSASALTNLYRLAHNTGTSVAINAAIPFYNDALVSPNGVALLKGGPVVIVPQALDDAMWRLGGCIAIGMKLVEDATSREELVRAVEIFFESIKGSWRNSEAMERENGYAVLAALLRGKLSSTPSMTSGSSQIGEALPTCPEERDKVSFELLSVVLGFVGYSHRSPEESMINNPMAYRTLVADFDVWRKSAPITQKLYYKQFITFAVMSKHHHYNSKRLARMRIVKRFLDALKAETFSSDIFPGFLEAFTVLVLGSLNPEVHRSLALFVTYSFHKPSTSASRTPKAKFGTANNPRSGPLAPRRPPINTALDSNADAPSPVMSKRELGRGVLQMYTNLLCEKGSTINLKRFAKTVTNKWLLHLLAEDDAEVVVLGTKILARLLVVHGSAYVKKFTESSGGFIVMRYRLKRWWDIPTLYPIIFSILFNYDVAEIDFERSFDLFSLSELFGRKSLVYPDVLPIIVSMLQQGLNTLVHNQDDPDSPHPDKNNVGAAAGQLKVPTLGSRRRSMSLTKELEARQLATSSTDKLGGQATVLHAVIRFLSYLHEQSQNFRDFAINSEYVRLLFAVLFPVVVNADAVSPETELNSRDSTLTFDGEDVIIRPTQRGLSAPSPVVRTTTVETHLGQDVHGPSSKAKPLRRGSSFILLTANRPALSPSPAKLTGIGNPQNAVISQKVGNAVVEELLELTINVFLDQILERKEFPGFGLYLKVPPGFQEHQAYFESYILRNTISHVSNTIQLQPKLLIQPKIITNMARFTTHITEAIFEGWFLGGAEPFLDFAGHLLDYFQQRETSKIKSVRLCNQAIQTIRSTFLRVVLLRLSEIDAVGVTEEEAALFMNKLLYWQTIFLSAEASEGEFLKLMCYQLYMKLVDPRQKICSAAADLWRILLVQKPDETSAILVMSMDKQKLILGFKRLMELDNESFVEWVSDHRDELDKPFFGALSRTWEDFVNAENGKTEEALKTRLAKRKDKLRQWLAEDRNDADVMLRHDLTSNLWGKNIYAAEHLKHQRTMQDQQENLTFLINSFIKMGRDLHRTCGVFDNGVPCKWRLDQTEGRNRMRLRLIPDRPSSEEYQPKRRNNGSQPAIKLNTQLAPAAATADVAATPISTTLPALDGSQDSASGVSAIGSGKEESEDAASVTGEEDFELIDDPNDNDDNFEDKQRKVMRSLERGDQVQHVFNISRIIGLEACEGLLILGKDSLYLIDDFFQRSDGEIVDVWNAPADERDPYVQMISGKEIKGKPSQSTGEQESRSWKWSEVLSVSKRRFLFRDVAVEVFFTDGRSYLLTALNPTLRNDLYSTMTSKAPHPGDKSSPADGEDAWRMEALKAPDETPTTLSSRLAGLMNSSPWNPTMRRWAKGEISNFHYLMLVNTMAGRTFNDLTQYPVFPWVIADYTSEELDLDNPATFRDLSKPMGCQHLNRAADFVERYKTFAEMGEQNPFHYGTHYTSAMIVASYLIRLQPFVQSYLLIQGGNFDHPDRMFYSIEKAWKSASKDNMTDVRELTPEFFCLPEFLTNSNGFNFGLRQGTGGSIDNVELPPWAKGDPKIFIAKNREALESPYASAHLHEWIDLVFGCKQNGEAAIENVNVFHHLSYRGATDLDAIQDHHEKLQTISIIHNFGQTPHQVFSKPHQSRDDWKNNPRRLDTTASSLTRLPFPLFEHTDKITSLTYAPKLDRLLCGSAFRLNMPSLFDKYMEWGYADNSVRFYAADSKKLLGLFENLHQGQLSSAMFVDSKTLVTAGVDCVLSVWRTTVSPNAKSVDLAPMTSLFGHTQPVSTLAVSKSFSTILSASTDGIVLLWDLNRLEFVLKLASGRAVQCAQINSVTGDILLCRGQRAALYTLNGDLMVDQNICVDSDDYVHSCAFYEGQGNEWLVNTLVFTGHRRGVVNCWRKCVDANGKWNLELVKRLDHVDQRKGGERTPGTITALTPMPTGLYTGDEDGKAYEWTCVQRAVGTARA
ncbi:Beige protein-like 1 [Pseudogymnoascus australis]